MTTGIIRAARSSRPVAAIPVQEMRCLLADIVVDEAFSLRCEPAEPKLVDAIIGLMQQELYTTYSSWCVDEIRIAIRAGVCSQLGPMYRLSPAEFIRIMEVYHSCPLRLEAFRQIRHEKEKPKPEDPETVARRNRECLAKVARDCFADVKAYGRITFYSDQTLANVLDFLLSVGILAADVGKTDNGNPRQRLEDILQKMIERGEVLAPCENESSPEYENTRTPEL
jgi:hypothetical protein